MGLHVPCRSKRYREDHIQLAGSAGPLKFPSGEVNSRMIEQLDGKHETVHYKRETHLKLYLNDKCEYYPPHWHTDMEIICPWEGVYRAICEDRVFDLSPGDILFIPGGIIHELPAVHGKRIIFQISWSTVYDIAGIQTILGRMSPSTLVTRQTMPDIWEKVHQDLEDILGLYQENGVLSEAAVYAKAMEMICLIGRDLQPQKSSSAGSRLHPHSESIQSVCAYIRSHCAEPISLQEAADMAGFSRYYFARLFRDFTDQSFHQYLIGRRLALAENLLIDTRYSIQEVALQAGFSSSAAFCKAFRQARGIAPAKYRSLYQH